MHEHRELMFGLLQEQTKLKYFNKPSVPTAPIIYMFMWQPVRMSDVVA